ncbi:MAG: class II glutamine amidotransferase [Nanoarchaeota archaeon]|nr:class II glutamine amidotransferase [Nanoarchaeota archaeon]MBU1644520.1 class II glutamine amidotransferase [Nanoarchaeota archaeon]MBU1976413.1 class II glutamine amidotransferase [Nanoarchaeota archaeon]
MLIASGNFDLNPILDGALLMAKDQNTVHELNKEKGLGSWIHDSGWGAAYLNKDKEWVLKKSIKPIYDDPSLNEIRKIKTNLFILHIRKKIGSEISHDNTHPFRSDDEQKKETFIFCHNGFIDEKITFDPKYELKGETDSEKLFYSILTDLKKNKLEKAVRKNLNHYRKEVGSNIILSIKEKAVIAIKENKFPKYYQMEIGKNKEMILVSSEHLTIPGLFWEPIEQGDIVTLDHDSLTTSISKEKNNLKKRVSFFKRIQLSKLKKTSNEYIEMKNGGTTNAN